VFSKFRSLNISLPDNFFLRFVAEYTNVAFI